MTLPTWFGSSVSFSCTSGAADSLASVSSLVASSGDLPTTLGTGTSSVCLTTRSNTCWVLGIDVPAAGSVLITLPTPSGPHAPGELSAVAAQATYSVW